MAFRASLLLQFCSPRPSNNPAANSAAADLETELFGQQVLRWFGLLALQRRRRGHATAARSRIHRRRGNAANSRRLAHIS